MVWDGSEHVLPLVPDVPSSLRLFIFRYYDWKGFDQTETSRGIHGRDVSVFVRDWHGSCRGAVVRAARVVGSRVLLGFQHVERHDRGAAAFRAVRQHGNQ